MTRIRVLPLPLARSKRLSFPAQTWILSTWSRSKSPDFDNPDVSKRDFDVDGATDKITPWSSSAPDFHRDQSKSRLGSNGGECHYRLRNEGT